MKERSFRSEQGTNGRMTAIKGATVGAGSIQLLIDMASFSPVASEWKLKGNCADRDIDPDMFFLSGHTNVDRVMIPIALAVCEGCPVAALCENEFTDEQKKWTVHGGKPPTGIKLNAKEKFLHEATGVWRYRYCPNGHDKFDTGYYNNGQCVKCKRASDERSKIRRGTMKHDTAPA